MSNDEINIDNARAFLKEKTKPEYHRYIDTQLAGDFAVAISIIIAGTENNKCLLYVDPVKSCQALKARDKQLKREMRYNPDDGSC